MTRKANISHVFHRHLRSEYPFAERAQGAYIYDAGGKAYLDASGGAAVSCLGHGHPRVIAAIKRQADRMAFAHSAFFTSEPAEQLADHLSARAPDGFGRVYFVSGGSEATETALKLARQIQVERGQHTRDHFIARKQSYHGNTLGALSVSDDPVRRELYGPLMLAHVRFVEPCHAYRHRRAGESEADYGKRAAASLEAEIGRLGECRAIAFIAETVSGARLGAAPPAPGYFKEIRRICDDHGLLMILDEVMCGMGRTGTLFACEQDGVAPDMITLAKGLGGGYQPIGALLVREELVGEIEAARGFFQHGHTYLGHSTACAAALAVQRAIEDEDLLARVRRNGHRLKSGLAARFADHPHVGDVRGRGFFIGLELVEERDSKKPFSEAVAEKIRAAAMNNAMVCYPSSGTADGISGDHVLLAPPFILTPDQGDELIDKLAQSLKDVLGI